MIIKKSNQFKFKLKFKFSSISQFTTPPISNKGSVPLSPTAESVEVESNSVEVEKVDLKQVSTRDETDDREAAASFLFNENIMPKKISELPSNLSESNEVEVQEVD